MNTLLQRLYKMRVGFIPMAFVACLMIGVPHVRASVLTSTFADARATETIGADGVSTYTIKSPYAGGETRVRILKSRERTGRVLFVLPVTPWPGFESLWKRIGDGCEEILKGDFHNRYGYDVVFPDFPKHAPWFVDHATDPDRRHEMHMMRVVVPFADEILGSAEGKSGKVIVRDLVGFSKSGYGALYLLLRHPEIFRACSAWDPAVIAPEATLANVNSLRSAAGSDERYKECDILRVIATNAPPFRGSVRMAISGYSKETFLEQLKTLHGALNDASVRHYYTDKVNVQHRWGPGWLEQALDSLAKIPKPNPCAE